MTIPMSRMCRWARGLAACLAVAASPSLADRFSSAPSPLTGLWWNANEPGWGLSVAQHGTILFAAWYTYDANGQPTWYVASDCRLAGASCSGELYEVRGGRPLTSAWSAAQPTVRSVGTLRLTFTGNDAATLSFTLDGVSGNKPITRQVWASGAPARQVSDLWWNAAESGWGMGLAAQGGITFATVYTYDASGNPTWYVASSCAASPTGCVGDLYRVTGGQPPTSAWRGPVTVSRVGTLDLAFDGTSAASMAYSIDGASSTRAVTRQAFQGSIGPSVRFSDVFEAANAAFIGGFRERAIRVSDTAPGASEACFEASGSLSRSGVTSDVGLRGGQVTLDTPAEFCATDRLGSFCFKLVDNAVIIEDRSNGRVLVTAALFGLADGKVSVFENDLTSDSGGFMHARDSSWTPGTPCPSLPILPATALDGTWTGHSLDYAPDSRAASNNLATMACANQTCTILGTVSATFTFGSQSSWSTSSGGVLAGAIMSPDGSLVSAHLCSVPLVERRSFESCTFYSFRR